MAQPFRSGRAFNVNPEDISGFQEDEEQQQPLEAAPLEQAAPKVVRPAPVPLSNPWDSTTPKRPALDAKVMPFAASLQEIQEDRACIRTGN